jgi:hypothetical protein
MAETRDLEVVTKGRFAQLTIASVTFPDSSVKELDDSCFANCDFQQELKLPKTVTKIRAFTESQRTEHKGKYNSGIESCLIRGINLRRWPSSYSLLPSDGSDGSSLAVRFQPYCTEDFDFWKSSTFCHLPGILHRISFPKGL